MKTFKSFILNELEASSEDYENYRINEVRRPKSSDERKFMDKHVTIKHADRNGNGDDLFNGKNIKFVDRPKERHGYNPGQDAEVYENVNDKHFDKHFGEHSSLVKQAQSKVDNNQAEDIHTGLAQVINSKHVTKSPEYRKKLHSTALGLIKSYNSRSNMLKRRGISESFKLNILDCLRDLDIDIDQNAFYDLMENLQEEVIEEIVGLNDDHAEDIHRTLSKMINSKHPNKSPEYKKKLHSAVLKLAHKSSSSDEQDKSLKHAEDIHNTLSKMINSKHPNKSPEYKKKLHFDVLKLAHKSNSLGEHHRKENTSSKYVFEDYEIDDLFSLIIEDLSEKNKNILSSFYEVLDLSNKINLIEALQEDDGLDEVLDFVLESNFYKESIKGSY